MEMEVKIKIIKAAYNTIGALQDYNKSVNFEKEKYKSRVIELQELLEKVRY